MTRTLRVVRGIGWAMIWTGALILAFLAYQLWGTGLVTSAEQRAAGEEVEAYLEPLPDDPGTVNLGEDGRVVEPPGPTGPGTFTEEVGPDAGAPMGIISFPSLQRGSRLPTGDAAVDELLESGLSFVVNRGEDLATLRGGPGHYLETPMPGQPGNAAIAGHRTTYGAPFNRLDQLRAGDPILVRTSIGIHTFVVRDPRTVHDEADMLDVGGEGGWMVVAPTALWVVDELEGGWLTLTTCHPEFSSRQRLVVVAELVAGPNARWIAEGGGS